MSIQFLTYFNGKPLSACSTGEIVNAITLCHNGRAEPEIFHDVLNEAIAREILPDAMWLIASQ